METRRAQSYQAMKGLAPDMQTLRCKTTGPTRKVIVGFSFRRTAARPMTIRQSFASGKRSVLQARPSMLRRPSVLDVEEWLRTMAFQQLVGPGDAYYTGGNVHNFRVYERPEDHKVLYLPWDWDSSFLASASAPIIGTGNIAKLLSNSNYRRSYLNHLFDIVNTTFNTAYMSRWTSHYGQVSGQNMSDILGYIGSRAAFVLGQIPTGTAFVIANNGGNSFGVSNSSVTIFGTAPISVQNIQINGVSYPSLGTILPIGR